ncbi:MAG TPA: hypothetical protein PKV72_02050 [Candidatus Peribacteria bacterium]|nr:hypothetical protein [Candidatus Peribacteria bacterium]
MPAESPAERKLVLPPAKVSALIKRLRGDEPGGADLSAKEILRYWEEHGATLMPFSDELEGAEELTFSTGPTAKAEKLAAGQAGNVFVQRGIALASGMTADQLRIALYHRSPDKHIVTTGGSIMVSGDIRKPPAKALKKVAVEPELQDEQFERLGLGFSSLKQTSGIPYLFDVTRGHLLRTMTVTATGDDAVVMATADQAEAAIAGKALELKILERMRMGS